MANGICLINSSATAIIILKMALLRPKFATPKFPIIYTFVTNRPAKKYCFVYLCIDLYRSLKLVHSRSFFKIVAKNLSLITQTYGIEKL